MAVSAPTVYAKVEMSGSHFPHPYLPYEVVGTWAGFSEVDGDASGGFVSLSISPLPIVPLLPYLPNLDTYFTLLGFAFNTTAAAQIAALNLYSDINLYDAGNQLVLDINFTLVASPTGSVSTPPTQGWQSWFDRRTDQQSGRVRAFYATNTDGKYYNVTATGLLLKPKRQLIDEELWESGIPQKVESLPVNDLQAKINSPSNDAISKLASLLLAAGS